MNSESSRSGSRSPTEPAAAPSGGQGATTPKPEFWPVHNVMT